MTANPLRTAFAILTFLAALAALTGIIFGALAGGAWILSEGFMWLFPADYAELGGNSPVGGME